MTPTEEQEAASWLVEDGEDMLLKAGPGTGKTWTLRWFASSSRTKVQFMAFGRRVVDEARRTVPATVAVNTANSLAFRAAGRPFRHRIRRAPTTDFDRVARTLGVPEWLVTSTEGRVAPIPAAVAAHVVLDAVSRFAASTAETIGREHFPDPGLADELLPAARRAWADMTSRDGVLPFVDDVYVRLWAEQEPRIPAGLILVDEAQDITPLVAHVLRAQDHAQVVWAGDPAQAIYGFGARSTIDLRTQTGTGLTVSLTKSHRFGPLLATVANRLGPALGGVEIVGDPNVPTSIGPVDRSRPWTVITRTNAGALTEAVRCMTTGTPFGLAGEPLAAAASLARAAEALLDGRPSPSPILAGFRNWAAFMEWAEVHSASEMAPLARLVEQFGADALRRVEAAALPLDSAQVIVTTAHQAKGLEWDQVRIGADFAARPDTEEERRTLFVALTRARQRIDPGSSRQ